MSVSFTETQMMYRVIVINVFFCYDFRTCPAPPAAKKRRRRAADPPCDTLPAHRDRCSIINNTNSVFSNCIRTLPPRAADKHVANCMLDAWFSNGDSICRSIRMFAFECKASGAQIPCSAWLSASACSELNK